MRTRDPKTVEEAMAGPNAEQWNKARDEKFKSLIEKETSVFKTKMGDGQIQDTTGRKRLLGGDYAETYSPVRR